MAYFLQPEIDAINKCSSYDELTQIVAYNVTNNSIGHLLPNIINAIDRLDINSSYNKFIEFLLTIYGGYIYTEAFNAILKHLSNKIATNIDSVTFEPDELSILVTFIYADDKTFYNKLTRQLKEKFFKSIYRYINQPYAIREYLNIINYKDDNTYSLKDLVTGYFDRITTKVINENIYDIHKLEKIDIPLVDKLRKEYVINWYKMDIIKIAQNLDIEFYTSEIGKRIWSIKIEDNRKIIEKMVIDKFKLTGNPAEYVDSLIGCILSWINGFSTELSKVLNNMPSSISNIYEEMAKYPLIGKYVYNFLEDIHYARQMFPPENGSDILYYVYNLCYFKFCELKCNSINSTVLSFIHKIIKDFSGPTHEDIFMSELYKPILIKFKNSEDGKYLVWDFAVQSSIATEGRNNKVDDDYEDSDDDESYEDDEDEYDGPEIDAKQSKKGYKKSSKIQSDGERKIYKAYKKYKNAESKVDSQLSKMLTSAKKAFSGDKTEEIIEGKKFTPIGLLKKILMTSAIFSYSKIYGFLYLIVSHTLSKKRTNAQRSDIIIQMNEEIKLLDEKIEDARGDGNRKAKYALMRTRSELVRARDKIKYGLSATKEDMKVAKNYISADRKDKDNI